MNKPNCFICGRNGLILYGIPSICKGCQGLKSSDVDDEKMREEREKDFLKRIEQIQKPGILMPCIGDNGGGKDQ